MYADIEAALGKPDRFEAFGADHKIHTWDSLGVIARDTAGRVTSMGFSFKLEKDSYSPKAVYGGSIIVDGGSLDGSQDFSVVKSRPGATQPYTKRSVIFDRGELHVFTIAADETS